MTYLNFGQIYIQGSEDGWIWMSVSRNIRIAHNNGADIASLSLTDNADNNTADNADNSKLLIIKEEAADLSLF